MEPIFRNSEPAHRAPLSQWQRDTMGKVQPMNDAYAATSWRQTLVVCAIVFAVVVWSISR